MINPFLFYFRSNLQENFVRKYRIDLGSGSSGFMFGKVLEKVRTLSVGGTLICCHAFFVDKQGTDA